MFTLFVHGLHSQWNPRSHADVPTHPWRHTLVVLALLIAILAPEHSASHTVRPAVVTVSVAQSGALEVSIRVSAELLLADIGPEFGDTDDAPNAALYDRLRALEPAELARQFDSFAPELIDNILLAIDGQRIALAYKRIDVPPTGDLDLSRDATVFLSGALPANAHSLTWAWPVRYGSNVLRVIAGSPETAMSVWLKPGEVNEPYVFSTQQARSRTQVIANYVNIGFAHILPKGLDHILFVLGLFLLSAKLRPLLWQVSAFTVAHTITLGLSIYGILALPSSIVEPLIALSIAYVGIENVLSDELKPWRIALVFIFGLLHGMGFAGVLSEIGLPPGEYLTALLSFNLGVEFGQLAIISMAFVLVGWFRSKRWYRQIVVIPASTAISVMGLYWTWERAFS